MVRITRRREVAGGGAPWLYHHSGGSSRDPQGFRRRSELMIECPDRHARTLRGGEHVCAHPRNAPAKEARVLDQATYALTLSELCLGEVTADA